MKVSMSAVWDRTTEFLSDNMTAVAGVAALAIFAPAAVKGALDPLKAGGPGAVWGLTALAIVCGVISLWGQLTVTAMALDSSPDTAAARARATRRLPAAIAVLLAVFAVAVVLVLPVIGTLYASGVDLVRLGQPGAQETMATAAGGFIALYGLLLLPVTIWLLARFVTLATPVVIAENQALGALGRSFRLSRGLTWRIIGVVLLYAIVMWVATLAAVTVFGSLFTLLFKPEGGITIASVLTALVAALVSTVFSVLGTVFPAKLYLAVRDREDKQPA